MTRERVSVLLAEEAAHTPMLSVGVLLLQELGESAPLLKKVWEAAIEEVAAESANSANMEVGDGGYDSSTRCTPKINESNAYNEFSISLGSTIIVVKACTFCWLRN